MGRRDKAINIYEVFPEEYKQLKEILVISENGVKLKTFDTILDPKYDAMYKLYSMLLAKTDRIKVSDIYVNDGNGKKFKGKKEKEHKYDDDILMLSRNDHKWLEYMFQIPGIETIFGVKRNFKTKNVKEVLQEPMLFLILLYHKISYGKRRGGIPDINGKIKQLAEYASEALNKHEKNNFNDEELKECIKFFETPYLFRDEKREKGIDIEKNISDIFALISDEVKVSKGNKSMKEQTTEEFENSVFVEEKKWSDVLDYEEDIRELLTAGTEDKPENEQEDEHDKKDIRYRKGERIKFPRYMQSILVGMGRYYKLNPFAYPREMDSLWGVNKMDSILGKEVSIEVKEAFDKICRYIIYKDIIKEAFIRINWTSETVKRFTKQYYEFCVGTYFGIIEDKKYREIANDTFEKIYALYLFNEETKIIYQKSSDIAEKVLASGIIDDTEKLISDIGRKIIEEMLMDILSAIYSSPGIYHRVELAKYILNESINVESLAEQYKNTGGKEEFQNVQKKNINDGNVKLVYRDIESINSEYRIRENCDICRAMESNAGKKDRNAIKKDYQDSRQENKKYIKFYEDLSDVIKEQKKNRDMKYGKPLAGRVVEYIFKKKEFKKSIYREIFWGVIWYSFISEKVTWVELEIEEKA